MKKHILKIVMLAILAILPLTNSTGAYFSDQENLTGIKITAGCWAAPSVPSLVYPANGLIAGAGSEWLTNPYMDWENSSGCPGKTITYQYESYLDAGLTSLAYRSAMLSSSLIPAPGTPDGTYYWRVRAYDGEKWSEWSSVWLLTVNRTPPPPPAPTQSVVINEIMWMGTTKSSADEWIELRNVTDSSIDISQWILENAGGSGTRIVHIPGSRSIPANGYYLISNYNENSANSALNTTVDQVASLSLLNSANGNITLKDSDGNVIDQAKGDSWPDGINGTLRQSMERNDTPGDGTLGTSWHTCTDSHCNDVAYWDSEGNDYGTPKSANLSENDSTETNLNFYFGSDTQHVSFTLNGPGLPAFDKANYTITYDSDQTMQGIVGTLSTSGQNEVSAANLFLGSCSDGDTCTANTGVKNINIEVKLSGGAPNLILNSSLSI